jgi:hypothetical protein
MMMKMRPISGELSETRCDSDLDKEALAVSGNEERVLSAKLPQRGDVGIGQVAAGLQSEKVAGLNRSKNNNSDGSCGNSHTLGQSPS